MFHTLYGIRTPNRLGRDFSSTMVFNSFLFILFFGIVLLLHNLPFSWKIKKLNLWMASYVFYAAWNPPFVLLLWISTLIDWFVGRRLYQTRRPDWKKAYLLLSLTVNLGLLGYFKYGGFILENFIFLLEQVDIRFQPLELDIVLPVGISFYTFQSLSYSLDIYRGKMEPWHSFSDFALYVTFFPQLVAGPIVRAADFLPQCATPHKASGHQLGWGFALVSSGLFQKVVLADALLAPVGDKVFEVQSNAGQWDAWLGTLAFSGQIFFDFSGYSTCAIGTAMCLGFALPDNFRYPYGAIGFSDFWKRWHISLSTWLRDYLYISLGGNRKGRIRTLGNLIFTMLVGGLWHGASWRFVVWGGLHGIYLVIERILRPIINGFGCLKRNSVHFCVALLTYLSVCITYVFFRATDLPSAVLILNAMFVGESSHLVTRVEAFTVLAINAALVSTHFVMRDKDMKTVVETLPFGLRVAVLTGLLITLVLLPGDDRAFIYFQF